MLENAAFDNVDKSTFAHSSNYHDPLVLQLPNNSQTEKTIADTLQMCHLR